MSAATQALKAEDLTLTITDEIQVKASLDVTFDALIEQLTLGMVAAEDKPMPMKIEQWPGGRWWRDLGDGNGHLWAHVQSIKRPTLLEFCGPLMMSFAATSNVQYRLSEQDGGTLIKFQHLVLGAIPADHSKGFKQGWKQTAARAKERAEKKR